MQHSRNPFVQFWKAASERRAIRGYLAILPRRLATDYGHAGPYTVAQVKSGVRRYGLSEAHIDYALAIFCDPLELSELRREQSLSVRFDELHREIRDRYFDAVGDVLCQADAWPDQGFGGDHGTYGGADGGHH